MAPEIITVFMLVSSVTSVTKIKKKKNPSPENITHEGKDVTMDIIKKKNRDI